MYAYTALILVLLTFGMETTFFRFANKEGEKSDTVFSTAMAVVITLSIVFLGAVFLFETPLCNALGYNAHHEYVQIMAITVALDAIKALPFCYLRFQKRALTFAGLQLLNIALNIILNLICFVVLGKTQVVYVFAINLACTTLITFCFVPDMLKIKWQYDGALLKRMLPIRGRYSCWVLRAS